MDKVKKYRQLVRSELTQIADMFRRNSNWEILEAYDDERGQYILFSDTWDGEYRDYGCFMHIEVKNDGKIWIRRDGTDLDIGQTLLEAGVPKQNMVLGFRSPSMRHLTNFATA